ncbi:unnamed protein product [Caenorhabditis auriculariae]|uniref:C2H2-type domain-containing protein n=1 Tax=Caenorhabditis auriculariae TaxID=2777116 RepID=A0A8S1HV85_9PELO|nr:unnamed protein product [Caenorhabditis auriculariae]
MVAAMTNEPVAVKGNTDKWSAIVDPAHWPSQKSLNFTKNCKICQVKLNSEFDVMAHLLSKNHVEKSKTLKVSCKISDYKKQEDALVQLKTAPLEKIETGNFLDGDENLANATEKMNKLQTRTAVPLPLSSPRARLRQIRDIANIFDKMSGCSIVDETTQKSMEKVLGDLLSSFEKSDGNESAITAEQLCAVGGVLRICDALLAWTKNTFFVRDIRVAYTILYQNQLMKIVELIVHLLTNEPTAPQLSALLDVLNALLQTVVGRISTSTDQKTWKELKSLDSNAPETIDVIAGFYRCSLKSSTIVAAVEATNGFSRLLYSTFMRIALEHALKCGRSASNGPRDQKIATDVAVIVVRALESLSSDLKFEDVWKTIVENGQNALMIRLILSNVLRSAISAATASEPPKNARHRQNPASSNNFTTSEAELVKLLEFIACFANAGNQVGYREYF